MIGRALLGVMALMCGVIGVLAYQAWEIETAPRKIFVRSVQAFATPTKDRVLTVRMETDPQPHCFRIGLHVMFQDDEDGERHYAPLSPAVNGLGFRTTMATKFTV